MHLTLGFAALAGTAGPPQGTSRPGPIAIDAVPAKSRCSAEVWHPCLRGLRRRSTGRSQAANSWRQIALTAALRLHGRRFRAASLALRCSRAGTTGPSLAHRVPEAPPVLGGGCRPQSSAAPNRGDGCAIDMGRSLPAGGHNFIPCPFPLVPFGGGCRPRTSAAQTGAMAAPSIRGGASRPEATTLSLIPSLLSLSVGAVAPSGPAAPNRSDGSAIDFLCYAAVVAGASVRVRRG